MPLKCSITKKQRYGMIFSNQHVLPTLLVSEMVECSFVEAVLRHCISSVLVQDVLSEEMNCEELHPTSE